MANPDFGVRLELEMGFGVSFEASVWHLIETTRAATPENVGVFLVNDDHDIAEHVVRRFG